MENNQLPRSEFVREQIKNKPRNKRKIAGKIAVSALCGAAFALAACLTLIFLHPVLKNLAGDAGTERESESKAGTTEEGTESRMPTEEPSETGDTEEPPTVITVPNDMTPGDYQRVLNELYAIGSRANRSVVTVTCVVSDLDWFNNPHEREGQGTGTIIEETAEVYLILTERQVITDASRISVTFIDGTTVSAELIGDDGNTGLAILAVKKHDLSQQTLTAAGVIPMGDASLVRRGTLVIALGSLLGTNNSVLTGSIMGTAGELSVPDSNYTVYITDIPASRNSSGILINTSGELVGIVMQDHNASSANTLTAVAAAELAPVIEHLISGREIPYLGLYVSTVTDKIANTYGLPYGVYVKQVQMDSPAMNAGIQSGDVIVEMNGKLITGDKTYYSALLQCVPGETCEVVIKRQGSGGYVQIVCEAEPGIVR